MTTQSQCATSITFGKEHYEFVRMHGVSCHPGKSTKAIQTIRTPTGWVTARLYRVKGYGLRSWKRKYSTFEEARSCWYRLMLKHVFPSLRNTK